MCAYTITLRARALLRARSVTLSRRHVMSRQVNSQQSLTYELILRPNTYRDAVRPDAIRASGSTLHNLSTQVCYLPISVPYEETQYTKW